MTQTFNCPNCGAPLEYHGSDPIIRCPYCNSSVIVPENLRANPKFSSKNDPFTVSRFGDLISQAQQIKKVKDLAQAGETDRAVALYRQITGADESTARQVVAKLVAGQPVVLSSAPTASATVTSFQTSAQTLRRSSRAIGCIIAFIAIASLIGALTPVIIKFGVLPAVFKSLDIPMKVPGIELPTTITGFATEELSFGGPGSGPGQFDDVRAIGVNPTNGKIYAVNYSGGRVQAFDENGKFITQWITEKNGTNRPYIGDIAVGRDGVVYTPAFGKLKKFDENGTFLGEIDLGNDYIDNLDIAADGTLVVIANGEDILWLSSEGKVLQRLDDAVSTISEDPELDALVAVDGLNNVYVLGTFNNAVFIFDSSGKYMNRFGSEGEEDGQFRAPMAIEVDGQGRVFVSDIKGIQVFSTDGRYLDMIKVSPAFGLAFDDQDKLYITSGGNDRIEKYGLSK